MSNPIYIPFQGWMQRVSEWMLVRQRSISVRWAGFTVRILVSIHVVFAGRELVTTQSYACRRWVHKRCSGISGKLKSNVDFHCRRCLEGEHGLFQSVLLKAVVIEPNVKLECVPKFCYLGDTLGTEGGSDSEVLIRGASHRMRGKIFRACVQSVLTYGTETWGNEGWESA